jgi:hypothetical protein
MRLLTIIFTLTLLVAACTQTNSFNSDQGNGLLRFVRTIPLPYVEGRIDQYPETLKGQINVF